MNHSRRLLVFLSVAWLVCLAVFLFMGRPAFKGDSPVKSRTARQAEGLGTAPARAGHSIRQADSPVRHRDENFSPPPAREGESSPLPPSLAADRKFPTVDLDVLAFRLPPEKFAVYERMRVEFPHVDWTEIDLTYQAFLSKRAQFPLNSNDGQREAYAAWIDETEAVSRALVQLRAEEHGLSANGIENHRGYYIDGFQNGVPVYVVTTNVGAAVTTGASFVRWNPGLDPALGDTIHGGELYVSINDHGTIYENPEFQLPSSGGSRILVKESNDAGARDHMTHVAGTVAAWGYDSSLQGMAPRAWIRSLIQQSTTHITTYAMATPGQQMGVLNPLTGNLQLRSVVGNTSMGYDGINTHYTGMTASYDSVWRDYPYYVHCVSAGNDGSGFASMTAPWSTGKNAFVIGAANEISRNSNGQYVSGGSLASFSSSGPTYDGRIKPDFVGKGVSVTSTISETGSGAKSGTSMSSPNVAGSVTVLMDYVRQRLPQQYLRSSTYKALLATTTDDLGNPGPDYSYGWGAVNVHAAAKIIRHQAEDPSQRLIIEDNLSSSQTWTETYYCDGTKPIRVSLSWLDPAGAASTDGDRSPRLINDLDLRIIGPDGNEHFPYVMPFATGQGTTPAFDTSLYNAAAVPGNNITDTIEQVYLTAPAMGPYTVRVTHKGALKDNQVQPFSVAASGLISATGVAPANDVVFTEAVPQDGLLSPGEEAVATVTLVNYLRDPVHNVVAHITTSDPDLTILADTVNYGTLATGQLPSGDGVFRIRLAPGASARTVALALTVTSTSSGGPWVHPVTCSYVNATAISGYVRNALGSPVAGATVSWTGTRTGQATSGANGYYAIPEIDGSYQVSVSAPGFVSRAPVSLTVPPSRTQDLFLDFYDLAITPNPLSLQAETGQTATAPVTLTNTGSLPVTWSLATSLYRVTTSAQSGGPAYVWNDISATGTQVSGLTDDTNLGPFSLGFSMPFYGQNFSSIRVCSNGWLSFTNTSTAYKSTVTLPNGTLPENLIAPLLRDLKLTTAGTVHYQQIDGDTFVVQFTDAPRFNPSTSLCTFQVVLKRDGTILFYYQRVDDSTVGLVGIQNAAKTVGLTLAYNQAFLTPGLAVRIQPTWLGFTPASGTIAVGSTAMVTVSANAAGLDSGSYDANLIVTSNDANTPVQTLPVSFTVSDTPPIVTIWPTASSLVYGQALSASTLSGGSAAVAGTFAFDVPATVLNAGSHNVPLTFTPSDTVTYDPVSGSVTVVVSKATPVITAWPAASAIDFGQYLNASTLIGGSASVAGAFAFNDPTWFAGSDAFTFKVNDGTVDSVPATVNLAVGASSPASTVDPLAESFQPNIETVADRITDLYVTCDNGYEVYVNGVLLGTGSNWQSAGRYQNTLLQVGRNVVAIKGTDAGGVAALLVEMVVNGQRIGSGSSWKRSLTAPADWKNPGFDDSAWVAASEYGAYGITPWNKNAAGMPADTPAKWIWSSNSDLDNTVYFRYVIDVISPNSPPVANSQNVTFQPGNPKLIPLTGSDPDGDDLTYTILTQPVYGLLSGAPPNVTYTPPALPTVGAHVVTVTFTPTDTANYHSVTGTVGVTVNGGATPYSQWAGQYPDHDLSEASGDIDGDGLNNFHEFAFGLNPTNGNSNNPIVGPFNKTSRSFSYTRRAGSGLTYTVCISADLRIWQALPSIQVSESVTTNVETHVETVGVTLSSLPDSENLFLRVKAD